MPDMLSTQRNTLDGRGKAVVRQQNAAKRAERRSKGSQNLLILGLGLGLGWTVYNNNRLAEKALGKEVIYVSLLASGDMVSSAHYTEVATPSQQAESTQNSLWTYVTARECFTAAMAPRYFYIAQAMSDLRVGRQAQRQFDPNNPDAPSHIYGDKGITVHCEPVDPPVAEGNEGNIFYFRFRRWEDKARTSIADIAAAPIYSVAVKFRTGVYPADPKRAWLDRSTFNASGVQVIDYPGAQPINARPPGKMSLSSAGDSK